MAEWHPLPTRDEASGVSAEWMKLNKAAQDRARHCSGDHSASLPDLRHLTSQDFQFVYEPSDDTYLLMDALKHEIQSGRWDSRPGNTIDQDSTEAEADTASAPDSSSLMVVLEVGCGSGVPSIVFRTEWSARYYGGNKGNDDSHSSHGPAKGDGSQTTRPRTSRSLVSLATDVNPRALQVARRTAAANPSRGRDGNDNGVMEFVRCDLASPLLERLEGQVDVILFNPPYVPTPDDEVSGSGIEASWAGGAMGRRVVDRFVPQLARLLSRPTGVAYLITVDDNRPDQLARELHHEFGLVVTPWLRRRAFNEHLTVQRITWKEKEEGHHGGGNDDP